MRLEKRLTPPSTLFPNLLYNFPPSPLPAPSLPEISTILLPRQPSEEIFKRPLRPLKTTVHHENQVPKWTFPSLFPSLQVPKPFHLLNVPPPPKPHSSSLGWHCWLLPDTATETDAPEKNGLSFQGRIKEPTCLKAVLQSCWAGNINRHLKCSMTPTL